LKLDARATEHAEIEERSDDSDHRTAAESRPGSGIRVIWPGLRRTERGAAILQRWRAEEAAGPAHSTLDPAHSTLESVAPPRAGELSSAMYGIVTRGRVAQTAGVSSLCLGLQKRNTGADSEFFCSKHFKHLKFFKRDQIHAMFYRLHRRRKE
jgi:hypothetical protein